MDLPPLILPETGIPIQSLPARNRLFFVIWLERGFPGVPFERYADDIICHCRSERQAVHFKGPSFVKRNPHRGREGDLNCKDGDEGAFDPEKINSESSCKRAKQTYASVNGSAHGMLVESAKYVVRHSLNCDWDN